MSDGLREYRLPEKKGRVVLACGKCQRKIGGKGLGRLKKAVKRRGLAVQVVEVGCMKVCPKGGVTVCTGEQMGRGVCSILWSVGDLVELMGTAASDAGSASTMIRTAVTTTAASATATEEADSLRE